MRYARNQNKYVSPFASLDLSIDLNSMYISWWQNTLPLLNINIV
jgi:hypothetical protein